MSLKIALLTYSTKPRGSVIHTLELAQALFELGHDPCVFALDKDGQGFHRQVSFTTCAVPAQPCNGGIDQLIHQRIEEFVQFFKHHKTHYDIYHAQDCLSANALAQLKVSGQTLSLCAYRSSYRSVQQSLSSRLSAQIYLPARSMSLR